MLSGDTARPYLTEGVGEDFFPGTFDPAVVDRWVRVSDADAFAAARRLTREEGILAGESCGTALVAALTVGRELTASGAGRRVGRGGAAARRRPVIPVQAVRRRVAAQERSGRQRARAGNGCAPCSTDRHHGPELPPVVLARTTDLVAHAIETLQRWGISQMPVTERDDDAIEGIVGSVDEKGLLERVFRDPTTVGRTVGELMERPLPTIDITASLDDAFDALSSGADALVAVHDGRPAGVVTKLDLLEHLAHRARCGLSSADAATVLRSSRRGRRRTALGVV